MPTDYGQRLKLARKRAGVSQVDLVRIAGCSQGNVSKVERSENGVGSEFTVHFAIALNISALWLATGQGEMTETELTPEELILISHFRHYPKKSKENILDICKAFSSLD